MTTEDDARWARRSLSEAGQKRRRYQLLRWRAEHAEELGRPSASSCNRPSAEGVEVTVTTSGRTHVSGIQRCKSVGSCPYCSPTIRHRRAADIEAAVEAAHAVGLEVWFLTLTIPHDESLHLDESLDSLRAFWKAMRESTTSRKLFKEIDLQGFVRAFEVTDGRNGWHPHLHVLLFTKSMRPRLLIDCWRARWRSAGIEDRWVPRVSADLRRVKPGGGVGAYIGKVCQEWGVGLELARADLKSGRGLAPPQLLELATTGEHTAVERWMEFEHCTKSLRWIEWSRGLRDRAATWQIEATTNGVELHGILLGDRELTDDEAAAAELREPAAARFMVPAATWQRAWNRGELGTLLWSLVCDRTEGFEVRRLALDRPPPKPAELASV